LECDRFFGTIWTFGIGKPMNSVMVTKNIQCVTVQNQVVHSWDNLVKSMTTVMSLFRDTLNKVTRLNEIHQFLTQKIAQTIYMDIEISHDQKLWRSR
jgi:hypothetical protein